MRKIFIVIVAATFVSCKGNSSSDIPNTDTVVADQKEISTLPKDQLFYGNWQAYVEHNATKSNDSIKLVITGLVELERPEAKGILIKASQQSPNLPGELTLNLSKRPRKTMNNPASVNFIEALKTVGQYKKLYILYRKDTVAIINNIVDKKIK